MWNDLATAELRISLVDLSLFEVIMSYWIWNLSYGKFSLFFQKSYLKFYFLKGIQNIYIWSL